MTCGVVSRRVGQVDSKIIPKLDRPKSRPPLVEEDGGGGFSSWEAVGARDWRIEYVRCIVEEALAAQKEFCGWKFLVEDLSRRSRDKVGGVSGVWRVQLRSYGQIEG